MANPKKVFISYVHEDKAAVDRICAKFKEHGIEYWIDRKDIQPGRDWKEAIRTAIGQGAFFLACFSQEQEKKQQSYMNEELNLAIEIYRQQAFDSGWLIPIKLSECVIPARPTIAGRTLQDLHAVDLYEDWEEGMGRLIDVIKAEDDRLEEPSGEAVYAEQLRYRGLKSLIEQGGGEGFHNADLGHPVYVLGAKGIVEASLSYADSPEKNLLFKELSDLSKRLKERGAGRVGFTWWYDFSEWKDFCRFAVDVYRRKKKPHEDQPEEDWREKIKSELGDDVIRLIREAAKVEKPIIWRKVLGNGAPIGVGSVTIPLPYMSRDYARWDASIKRLLATDIIAEMDANGMIFQLTERGFSLADYCDGLAGEN